MNIASHMESYIHSSSITSFPVDLVITRYLGNSLYCSENTLCLLPCSSLSTYTPLRIISRTYRVSAHPQLFVCFTKFFKIIFELPKILSSLLILKFLLACIMVNPISLVILLASFVTIILNLLILYVCECMQSSVDPDKLPFRLRRLSNMSWFSANQIAIDCTPKSIQLLHP